MTVKELISKLLEMPMNAEVSIYDPTPHKDKYGICKGYCFGIDDVTHDFDVELRFTDWRNEDYSKRLSDLADTELVGDAEMNAMIRDLAEVLHSSELWKNGECSDAQYQLSIAKFKNKWYG